MGMKFAGSEPDPSLLSFSSKLSLLLEEGTGDLEGLGDFDAERD